MPTIDKLISKTKRKFTKSDYRPWNYMDEIDEEKNKSNLKTIKESSGNQLAVIEEKKSQISVNKSEESLIIPIKKNNVIVQEKKLIGGQEQTLDIVFRLTGYQKRIFFFIVERCMSRGMLSSNVIKGETLVDITNTTMKMVKTSIQRLVSKGLVIREKGKPGRGGFYSFRIIEIVRNATIEYKRIMLIENQSEIKQESNGIQSEGNKVEIKNKIKNILPTEWENINIFPLEDIGFNCNHLQDIFEPGLIDPQVVQESILHFAYGLEHEPIKYKGYDDLLNVLIGRLRKGKPWYEGNYRSPRELAQQKLLENKKAELERKKSLEENAYKLALAEWKHELCAEDVEKIAPDLRKKGDPTPQVAKLGLYFKKNIWPNIKAEYQIIEN